MLSLDVEKETGQPFDRSRLHIVYSFSKDFGINGFRLGAVISQHNAFLLRCMMASVFLMKGALFFGWVAVYLHVS